MTDSYVKLTEKNQFLSNEVAPRSVEVLVGTSKLSGNVALFIVEVQNKGLGK